MPRKKTTPTDIRDSLENALVVGLAELGFPISDKGKSFLVERLIEAVNPTTAEPEAGEPEATE